jgi:hypothetical protein
MTPDPKAAVQGKDAAAADFESRLDLYPKNVPFREQLREVRHV